MEWWMTLIVTLLGGTTITSVYEAIRYRRENKRQKEVETEKKENELKDNETDTQMKQMNMADKYFEGMLKMLEQVKSSQESGNVNQEKMINMLSRLDTRMDTMESKVGYIEKYLNGDYKTWLDEELHLAQQMRNLRNAENEMKS